jgi:hypothetical protein
VENFLRACSGCAGDYEDPDRSAWEPDPEENEADTTTEEIPENEEPSAPEDEERPEQLTVSCGRLGEVGAEEAGWELERTGLSGSSRADMEPVTARLKSCLPVVEK